MRKITWTLVIFVVSLCLSLLWNLAQEFWFKPIQVVSLADKLQYADPALVKDAVAAEVRRGFFGMHLSTMRDRLVDVPWVVAVSVQRKWPDTVILHVQERQPLALFGSKGIVDTTGKLFFPPLSAAEKQKFKDLPEFICKEAELSSMVQRYLWILAKIKPIGLAVRKLAIMSDHGWQAMLDNGVTIILGQNELEERLNRFVLAYNDHKSVLKNANIHVVDLRYTNGLAISG